jgi:hypothetical protein
MLNSADVVLQPSEMHLVRNSVPRRCAEHPGAGHGGELSMPDPNLSPDPEPAEPTVHELLLARIDEHCRLLGLELDQALSLDPPAVLGGCVGLAVGGWGVGG